MGRRKKGKPEKDSSVAGYAGLIITVIHGTLYL